jgi:hypothetical protein
VSLNWCEGADCFPDPVRDFFFQLLAPTFDPFRLR